MRYLGLFDGNVKPTRIETHPRRTFQSAQHGCQRRAAT
jgi:hypothetical protein